MKACLILLCFMCVPSVGQENPKPSRSPSSLESRQGHHPDGPDLIGRMTVSTGATLKCDLTEIYDETHNEQSACIIRYKDGTKYTLTFGQSMQSPKDGTVYLECGGDKPRRCKVTVNVPVKDGGPQ